MCMFGECGLVLGKYNGSEGTKKRQRERERERERSRIERRSVKRVDRTKLTE